MLDGRTTIACWTGGWTDERIASWRIYRLAFPRAQAPVAGSDLGDFHTNMKSKTYKLVFRVGG